MRASGNGSSSLSSWLRRRRGWCSGGACDGGGGCCAGGRGRAGAEAAASPLIAEVAEVMSAQPPPRLAQVAQVATKLVQLAKGIAPGTERATLLLKVWWELAAQARPAFSIGAERPRCLPVDSQTAGQQAASALVHAIASQVLPSAG